MNDDPSKPSAGSTDGAAFAGLWRRVAAFIVDALVLAVLGQLLGAAFSGTLVHLGPWDRLLGFLVAAAWFVPQDSRLLGGQTPGKRMLGLRVVDASGAPPAPGRAAARFAILGGPYFINGAALPMGVTMALGGVPLALAVFGAGLSLLYLLLFNRRTRQSLHDLLTGTFVVRAAAAQRLRVPGVRTWAGHATVVGLLMASAAGAPILAGQMARAAPFAGLHALYDQVTAQPEVRSASVVDSVSARYGLGGDSRQRVLLIRVGIESPVMESGLLATRLAGIALAVYPGADREDMISVRLTRGWDLGIAWRQDSNEFAKTPEQWRDRVAAGAGA